MLIFDENCLLRFSLKISLESLDPLRLNNISYKRSGRFLDYQPLEVTIIILKVHRFTRKKEAFQKVKSGKKERQKVPQESDGRRKKAFEGQSIPFSDKSCRMAFDEFAICPCP